MHTMVKKTSSPLLVKFQNKPFWEKVTFIFFLCQVRVIKNDLFIRAEIFTGAGRKEKKKSLIRDIFKKISELSFKDNPLESVYFSHFNKDGLGRLHVETGTKKNRSLCLRSHSRTSNLGHCALHPAALTLQLVPRESHQGSLSTIPLS